MASLKKKLFSVKVHPKTLIFTVCLDVRRVTCPVVWLSGNNDIYLSVCIMGQWKRTPCLPPVFPLRFNHKMVFSKSFPRIVYPADLADLLKADTTYFELIQLVPPDGEVLATMEENSRDFLYPGLRLSSREGTPEREILMKRSSAFPGISPKVEFGTISVIEETDGSDSWSASPPSQTRGLSPARPSSAPSKQRSPKKSLPFWGRSVSPRCGTEKRNAKARISHSASTRCPSSPPSGRSPEKHTEEEGKRSSPRVPVDAAGYQRPTASSRARALSPYTHRRMCQLSEDARQRLSHLQLGPYHFRRENESQPPFLVSVCSNVSGMGTPSSSPQSDGARQRSVNLTADHPDSSLLGNYRPKTTKVKWGGSSRVQSSPESYSRREARPESPARASASAQSNLAVPNSRRSLNFDSSLTERLQTTLRQIHDRVQRILRTHKITLDHEVTGDL